jgi:anti-anti-sigma factor
MCQVSHLDSSAIGVLVACNGVLKNSGGQLRLAGVNPRIDTIFKITGVDGVLLRDATRDAAISALSLPG